MFGDDCIRCGEAPGTDEQGNCALCHGAVKLEIHEGLHQLRVYLEAWARFADWRAGRQWP